MVFYKVKEMQNNSRLEKSATAYSVLLSLEDSAFLENIYSINMSQVPGRGAACGPW